MTIGTLIHDAVLTNDNINWFALNVSTADVLVFSGDMSQFVGNMVVDFYDRANAGEIGGSAVPQVDSFELASTSDEVVRDFTGVNSVFLIGISDDGAFTAGVLFDFLVANAP